MPLRVLRGRAAVPDRGTLDFTAKPIPARVTSVDAAGAPPAMTPYDETAADYTTMSFTVGPHAGHDYA